MGINALVQQLCREENARFCTTILWGWFVAKEDMHKNCGWLHLSEKWAGVFEDEFTLTAGSH